jgi:hypothetical protein
MKLADMRGDSKLGCLIWLGILVAVLFVGYKFGAAQWAFFSFREELFDLAKSASRERSLDQGVYQKEIIRHAENLGILLDPEDISITETDNEVTLEVDWYAALEFPGYTYFKDFSVTASHKKGL